MESLSLLRQYYLIQTLVNWVFTLIQCLTILLIIHFSFFWCFGDFLISFSFEVPLFHLVVKYEQEKECGASQNTQQDGKAGMRNSDLILYHFFPLNLPLIPNVVSKRYISYRYLKTIHPSKVMVCPRSHFAFACHCHCLASPWLLASYPCGQRASRTMTVHVLAILGFTGTAWPHHDCLASPVLPGLKVIACLKGF